MNKFHRHQTTSVLQKLLFPIFMMFLALISKFQILKLFSFKLYDSDQAILGLMAKHILEGKWMTYYYGQNFMGSLEAYVAAMIFMIRGINFISSQMAPLLFYLLFIFFFVQVVERWFDRSVAWATGLWLTFSPPLLTRMSLAALGGYPETLFFASLFLWLLPDLKSGHQRKYWKFLAGLALGLGAWTNFLLWTLILPIAIFYFLKSNFWRQIYSRTKPASFSILEIRKIQSALIGFMLGYSPEIIFFILPSSTLLSSSLASGHAAKAFSMSHHLQTILSEFFLKQTLGLDIRNFSAINYGVFFYAILVLITAVWFLSFLFQHRIAIKNLTLLKPVENSPIPMVALLFIIPLFIALASHLESERYLLPLYLALSIMVGLWIQSLRKISRMASIFVLTGMLSLQIIGTIGYFSWIAPKHPGEKVCRSIIETLKKENICGAYSSYWISYLITFATQEDIIVAPVFGHNRYPAYTEFIKKQSRFAYFDNDPNRIASRKAELTALHFVFKEIVIDSVSLLIIERNRSNT